MNKNNKWIPVDERLPKAESLLDGYPVVLVSTDSFAVLRGYYSTEDKVWYVEVPFKRAHVRMLSKIKAWRPLPEPYKGSCDE